MKPGFSNTPQQWMYGLVAAVTLALAALVVFDSESGLLRLHELRHQHDVLSEETHALEARRDHLVRRLEQLDRSDPLVLESIARDKNMIRPGDTVYRIHYRPAPPTEGR